MEGGRPTFGLVHGKSSRVSFFIRLLSTFRGELPSVCNHAFCVRGDGETIVESVPSGTRESSWREAYDKQEYWGVLVAPRGLSITDLVSFESRLDAYLGTRYGFAAIVKHFVDGILGRLAGRDVYLFRRLRLPSREGAARYNICSWLVCWTHRSVGWRFHGPDGEMDCDRVAPDDLWDDVFEHRPERYFLVSEFGAPPAALSEATRARIRGEASGDVVAQPRARGGSGAMLSSLQ